MIGPDRGMPIVYERDDEHRRVVWTGSGSITGDEAVAPIDRKVAEGVWTYGILYDIRDVATLPRPSELFDILDYVRRQVGQHGPRGPVAVVVSPSRNAQRVRTYASLTDPSRRLETFTDMNEALRWLTEQTPARTP